MNASFGHIRQRLINKAAATIEKALEQEDGDQALTVDEHLEKAAAVLRAQGLSESKVFSTLRLEINKLEQSKHKTTIEEPNKEPLRIGTTIEKFAKPFVSSMLMRSKFSRRTINKIRKMKTPTEHN